jgi:hypothetical protein
MGVTQRLAQGDFILRDHDQMNMVRHKAIGPDTQPSLLAVLPQKAQICLSIFIVFEDICTTVPTLGHVMGKTGNNDSGNSAHESTIGQMT